MNGRRYYLTTIAAWCRHAPHCAETHFVALDSPGEGSEALAGPGFSPAGKGTPPAGSGPDHRLVLALITADEAAHIALEDDSDVEALPHPLARTPISARAAAALASFGVVPGDDTFTVAEKLARANPLLRHRVF
jgi:hypothetical protein